MHEKQFKFNIVHSSQVWRGLGAQGGATTVAVIAGRLQVLLLHLHGLVPATGLFARHGLLGHAVVWRLRTAGLHLLLGSHDCSIDLMLDVVHHRTPVELGLDQLIGLQELLQLAGQLIVLSCDKVHVLIESIYLVLHLMGRFQLSSVLLLSLVKVVLKRFEFTLSSLKSDFRICLRNLKFLRPTNFVLVCFLQLALCLLMALVLLFKVADLVVELLQIILETLNFVVRRAYGVFNAENVFFALYYKVLLVLDPAIC